MSYPIPKAVPVHTTNCENFKGVDFASAPTEVHISRSPDALNMISDDGMLPIKCKGSRFVIGGTGTCNGFGRVFDSEEKILYHAGNLLYELDLEEPDIVEVGELNNSRSQMFTFLGKLYILDGQNYKAYHRKEGWELQDVFELAYTPTTTIARSPTGGGVAFEDVNMLQPKRRNMFYTTSAVVYQLDTDELDDDEVIARILDNNGVWNDLIEDVDFTVLRTTGLVTFLSPLTAPPVLGQDNLEITFSKTVVGYANRVEKCTVADLYGVNGEPNRVFMTGNPEFPNYDWYSALNDASYMPDINYSIIGQPNSAIIGYSRVGEFQTIHKEDNQQDATVFMRSGYLEESNNIVRAIFAIHSGVVGVGAISKWAFSYLNDDSLFLSADGVFAVATNQITSTRYAQPRSYYINRELTREKNLESAVSIVHRGYYYLAINGHVYVADSRQKSTEKSSSSGFQYEWYYLDSKDVQRWFSHNGKLYYGNSIGKIFEVENTLGRALDEQGKDLHCYWCTPLLDYNDITRYKTLKNLFVDLQPFTKTSIKIYYKIKSRATLKNETTLDIFEFDDVDFDRFTFDADITPRIVTTNKKARKFMMIQFKFANESYEPFGIFKWATTHTVGSKYKGRR